MQQSKNKITVTPHRHNFRNNLHELSLADNTQATVEM